LKGAGQVENPTYGAGFSFSYRLKQSIVVVMAAFLDDHDLGIVIPPAVVMAVCPPTVKPTIVMTMLRDYNCSVLCMCGNGRHRNCGRA
jgi:hypothetical protein